MLALLIMQPDLGMSIVVAAVWAQLFVVSLPMWLAAFCAVGGAVALVGAYFTFNHVRSRFDRFLDPSSGDNYQVNTSLEAFMNSSLFGRGPGEGTVKAQLPDAHTDYGWRWPARNSPDRLPDDPRPVRLRDAALDVARLQGDQPVHHAGGDRPCRSSSGLQAAINMASTIQLIPAKGMTLPFISYGGSSALAMAICVGMLLSLTREHAGLQEAV